MRQSLIVRFVPSSVRWNSNSFYLSLRDAVEGPDVSILRSEDDFIGLRWLFEHRRCVDVLHLHWLHYHYSGSGISRLVGSFKLVCKLLCARALGYRLIWTVHNLYPHDSTPDLLERFVRMAVANLAHVISVFCSEAAVRVRREFRCSNVVVIPHGPYSVVDEDLESRAHARALLGWNDKFVYLFFGAVRRYKGVESLVASFCAESTGDSRLLIVGRCSDEVLEMELRSRVRQLQGVQFVNAFLSEVELDRHLAACDVVVLPYRDVLTSGSVVRAMSAGRAVIAPEVGCIRSMVGNDAGITYSPIEADGLQAALGKARRLDLAAMGQVGRRKCAENSWLSIGEAFRRAYRGAP